MDIVPEKVCSVCKNSFPATTEYFNKKERGIYGLCSWCKKCHSSRCKTAARAWSQRNPEKQSQATYNYKHSERGKKSYTVSWQKRQARKLGLPNDFSQAQWSECLAYFDNCCAVCGRPQGLWYTLAMDHWIPISSPDCPGTIPSNIVPMCHGSSGCNNSKSNKMPHDWLRDKYGKRKSIEIIGRIEAYFEAVKNGSIRDQHV